MQFVVFLAFLGFFGFLITAVLCLGGNPTSVPPGPGDYNAPVVTRKFRVGQVCAGLCASSLGILISSAFGSPSPLLVMVCLVAPFVWMLWGYISGLGNDRAAMDARPALMAWHGILTVFLLVLVGALLSPVIAGLLFVIYFIVVITSWMRWQNDSYT